ncbi:MAG: hypothetical protein KKH22_03325 [Proteobacteria bacterium]|nr:hypothetical protein [Pseudomonadota bacterium]
MKITPIIPGQQDVSTVAKNSTATSGPSFQDILEQELAAAKSFSSSDIPAVSATAQIPAALRLDSLALAEDTISTLENFSAALGNSSFSAQDLEPFAAALEDETAALVSLKNQLPANNPLSALLERVATASYVEAAKLRRGDYHA